MGEARARHRATAEPCAEASSAARRVVDLRLVSPRWVRRQIEAGRLRATVLATGERVTYRVARADLDTFRVEYLRDSWDVGWRMERDE